MKFKIFILSLTLIIGISVIKANAVLEEGPLGKIVDDGKFLIVNIENSLEAMGLYRLLNTKEKYSKSRKYKYFSSQNRSFTLLCQKSLFLEENQFFCKLTIKRDISSGEKNIYESSDGEFLYALLSGNDAIKFNEILDIEEVYNYGTRVKNYKTSDGQSAQIQCSTFRGLPLENARICHIKLRLPQILKER